jgi:hypothetical protein
VSNLSTVAELRTFDGTLLRLILFKETDMIICTDVIIALIKLASINT